MYRLFPAQRTLCLALSHIPSLLPTPPLAASIGEPVVGILFVDHLEVV